MKNNLHKIKSHPKYESVLNWAKLISITGSAQIVVQAIGFVSGILIIRLLPVEEYAFYTLANTMLGTMSVLTDGGISTGVMSAGGKVWEDKQKLGAVLATGLDLRRKFAIGSLIVSIPILFYLLLHNGASWLMTILISLSMIPAFYAALSDSLLEIIPKLKQTILPLQQNQVEVGLGRLALSGVLIFFFPFAYIGVLAAGIPRMWGNIRLRKIVYESAASNQESDEAVKKEIIELVKRILPTSIYYCVSGQITIWLISIFGNTTSLAQLGALGRLSLMLGVLGTIVGTLVVPRFAKLVSDKKLILVRFIQILVLLFIVLSIVVLIVYLFPRPILWILGNGYSDLNYELLLSIISSCIGLMAGIVFNLYSSRGWAMSPILMITVNVASIIFLATVLDLSNLVGALYFNLWLSCIGFFQLTLFCLFKIKNINND